MFFIEANYGMLISGTVPLEQSTMKCNVQKLHTHPINLYHLYLLLNLYYSSPNV